MPTGFHIASAWVDVRAEDTGLRQQVRTIVQKAAQGQDINIPVNIQNKGLRQELTRAVQAAAGGQGIGIPLTVRSTGLRREVQAALQRATKGQKPTVELGISTKGLRREIQTALNNATSGKKATVPLGISSRGLRGEINRAIRTATAGQDVVIPARIDEDGVTDSIRNINEAFQRSGKHMRRWQTITLAAVALIPPALATVQHGLQAIAPASAVAVSSLMLLGTAAGTLRVAFEGMGKAMKAALDPSTANVGMLRAQIAGLAPSAQKFVTAMWRLQGAFRELRLDVQQQFFKGMHREMKAFGRDTLPAVHRGLTGMAGVLNGMGRSAFQAVNQLGRMGTLDQMFGGLQIAMKPLTRMPGQILTAIAQLTIASTPLLTRMTRAVGRASNEMSRKLTRAFNDGRLMAAINQAGNTIVRFFRRIANNPEWQAFIRRMKETGPELARALGHIAEAALKLVNALAPISGAVIKIVEAIAKVITAIPTGILTTLFGMVAAFKALSLLGGGLLRLAGAMRILRTAMVAVFAADSAAMVGLLNSNRRFRRLGMSAVHVRRLGTALRYAAKGGIIAAAAFLAFKGIGALMDKIFNPYKAGQVDKLAASFQRFARTGKLTGTALKAVGKDFTEIGNAVREIAHPSVTERIGHFFDNLLAGTSAWDEMRNRVSDTDKALAKLVKGGNIPAAAAAFSKIKHEARQGGTSLRKLKELFPQYTKALKNASAIQQSGAVVMERYGAKALSTQRKLKQNNQALQAVKQSLIALNTAARMAMGGEIAFEAAIDNATAAAKKNGATLDINTAKGRANKTALIQLAQATDDAAQAKFKETGNWADANRIYQRGRNQLIQVAQQMGLSAKEAKKLADKILRIPNRKVTFDADIKKLNTKIGRAQNRVDKLKQKRKTAVDADKKKFDRKIREAMRDLLNLKQKKKTRIDAEISALNKKINKAQNKVDRLKQKKKTAVGADKRELDRKLKKAQDRLDRLKQKKKPLVKAKDRTKGTIDRIKRRLDNIPDETVWVIARYKIAFSPKKVARSAKSGIEKQIDMLSRRDGGVIPGFARGGAPGGKIRGPGTKTSDSILAAVSTGEFVMRAKAVDKYGVDFMNAVNSAKMPEFAVGGVVGGAPKPGGATKPATPRVAPTAGGGAKATLTATDATGPALMSAQKRFIQFKRIVNTTYRGINRSALLFGNKQKLAMTRLGMVRKLTWDKGLKDMSLAVTRNYAKIGRTTKLFGVQQDMAFKGSSRRQLRTWTQWGTGLSGRTRQTYTGLKKETGSWSKNTEQRFGRTKNDIHKTWTNWRTGMEKRTNQATGHMGKQTKNWGQNTERRIGHTKNSAHKTWSNWGNGMEHRTNKTYGSLKRATDRWGDQTTRRFGQAKNSVGKAWSGVKPKLAAPIKYLINKVINRGVVPAMNKVVKELGGSAKLKRVSAGGFATGGYVSGPGSGTSDSIPARLSNGEYVMKASAVRKYGVSTMNRINGGRAPQTAPVQYASGGMVGKMPGFAMGGMAVINRTGKSKLEEMLGDYEHKDFEKLADWIFDNAVWPLLEQAPGGRAMKSLNKNATKLMHQQAPAWLEANVPFPMGGANIQKAKKWARSQAGKPYQWGGAGNPSWDCSGFMGGIQKVIQGRNPKGRLYSTFAFQGNQAPAGWKRHLKSPFMVGVTNRGKGHMAGTLGGMNVESAGGVGVRVGKSARGAKHPMFGSNWYGFKPALGGLGSYNPSKGVKQWTGVVHQALRETNQSLGHTRRVLMQMQSESGGNPRAVNRTDINWRLGHPSVGLMQVIRPTFNANAGKYRSRGPKMYGVSINPLANIYAAIRYVLRQYGSITRGMRGHAYASGGFVSGRGSGTSDSIPARLSNGEYVMSAKSVSKYGTGFMDAVNRGSINGLASGGSVGTHVVKKGDTLWALARRFNTTVDTLVALNNIANKNLIFIGQTLRTSAKGGFDYQIKWGDTLSEIAVRFGTTVDQLMKMNKQIKDADRIFAGDTIRIPGSGGGSGGGGGGGTPTPTFNPPYSFEPLRKAKDDEIQEEEAKKALQGFVTISELSKKIGFNDSEIINALTGADSMEALFDTFWDVRKQIDDAFQKDIRDKLIKRMDLAGEHLLDWQSKLDSTNASLETATTELETLTQNFESLKESVMDSVVSFGSITSVAQFGVSPQTILNKLQTDVSKATAFAGQLEALKAAGVSGALIGQIAEAGLSGGGANMARSLLSATPEQIAELNRLQGELVAVGTRTGTAAADAMYGAGLEAAQGVIDGLTDKKEEIMEAMRTIALAMEKSIKEALGIASPSRVMMKLARFVPLGFAEGIKGEANAVMDAVMEMCGIPAKGVAPIAKAPAVGSGPATSNSGIISAGSGGIVIHGDLVVRVDGTLDISKPQAARDFARKVGPAMKEELRRYDKERR